MRTGGSVVVDAAGLDALVTGLHARGYATRGPVVRDGAIVPGPIASAADLPVGWHDEQEPGHYRLRHDDDDEVFGWAVGPGSWKAELLPPATVAWRATVDGDRVEVTEPDPAGPPLALVGARPCELAALDVLDRVLGGAATPDPHEQRRRRAMVVVAAECGSPAATCFCSSMGTGPSAGGGFDLALTELHDGDGRRYLVRVGTERGAALLRDVPCRPATEADHRARQAVLQAAEAAVVRRLDTDDLAGLLARNLEHPRWDEVAERCLACGNCTSVCPTCFCSDVRDTTDLAGTVTRRRTWASCFDLDHSYLHGGPVRRSTRSRYRQWMTHKLSTWWDQFGTSGCVGCGRCVTWCPVGIDITEEAAAIRRAGGDGGDRAGGDGGDGADGDGGDRADGDGGDGAGGDGGDGAGGRRRGTAPGAPG